MESKSYTQYMQDNDFGYDYEPVQLNSPPLNEWKCSKCSKVYFNHKESKDKQCWDCWSEEYDKRMEKR